MSERTEPDPVVERVAQAMWTSDGAGRAEGWNRTANRDVSRRRARAALAAMGGAGGAAASVQLEAAGEVGVHF